jgi:hypothetical protein
MIGGERMLSVIESYARIDAPLVRGELFDAWTGFDMGAYRDRVVMKMPWWGELLKASSPGRKDLPPIDELVRLVELLCYRGEHLGKAKTFEEAISRFMKWRWLYLGSLEDELGSSAPTGSKVPDQEPRTSVEVDEERRRPKDKAKLITLADLKRVVAIESLDDVRLAVPVEAAALPLLAKLQGLTEFGLILNDATLLSSVARFNRLERLHLKGDSYSGRSASPTIYDLGPLKELPDLKSLSIEFFWEDARIEMPSLDELPKLTKIEVVYSCVGRVLGQVRSRYLEELNLHVGSVGDLLDLSACSALHTLTISVEEPTTLKLPGTIVSLRIMQGANVTLEGDFSSLERLYIGGKKTHLKMEPLFEAPALKKVVVDDSPNALKPEVRQMLVDRGVEFEAR